MALIIEKSSYTLGSQSHLYINYPPGPGDLALERVSRFWTSQKKAYILCPKCWLKCTNRPSSLKEIWEVPSRVIVNDLVLVFPARPSSPPFPQPHPQLCPSFNLVVESLTDKRTHVLLSKWCKLFYLLFPWCINGKEAIHRPRNKWGTIGKDGFSNLYPRSSFLIHLLIVIGWMFVACKIHLMKP